MKKIYLLVLLSLTVTSLGFGQTSADGWINEIHYDNNGGDVNEGVEIVIADVSTYPLSNWTVLPYNGSNGQSYTPSGNYTSPDNQSTVNGFTIAYKNISGLQNGAPDGLALYYDNGGTLVLVQFLSYEGSFSATNGVANGQASTDIGVSEAGSSTIGHSLQLSGNGNQYSNFTWQGSATSTYGLINNGQTLAAPCPTYSLPFNENFDTGVPPTCWTQYPGTNGFGLVQQWVSTGTSHTGAGAAYVQWEDVTGGLAEDWLVTPAIDMTGSTNNELTFWTKDGFGTDEGNTYSIKVSTTSQTNIASFANVVTYDETQLGNTYNQKTVDLSAYSGNTVYVAFVMTNDDGDAWFLDDVSIYDSTVCTPPTQATAYNTTNIDGGAGTATLNWTSGTGDSALVVMNAVNAVNTDPSTGTTYTADAAFGNGDDLGGGNFVVYDGTSNSVNITNLIPNTTYYVAVYEYNSAGTCYNTDELTGDFFVPCATYTLPFNEGFEGAGFPPACWTSFRGSNGLGTTFDWTTTTDANTGSKAAFVDFENVIGGTAQDWLVTPAIDLTTATNSTLTFFSKVVDDFADDGAEYTVRVSTTSQTTGFAIIQTFTETQISGNYLQQTVDLSAYDGMSTIYVAFVLDQDNQDGWYLDDVNIDATLPAIDADTEVYDPTAQIAATTIIAADVTTAGTAEDAFSFTIEDQGTNDLLPTNVTTMRFVPGANNTADWTDEIQGVTLIDENSITYTPTTVTINDDEIILDFATAVVIPNATALEFTLGIYLNTTAIVDGSIVQLQINGASSGFAADASGSGFSDPFLLGTVTGNNITIDVDVTEIVFSQQPTDTDANVAMTPAVTVSGVDVNGNLDTDYNLDVSITSTGTLAGSPVTVTASSGVATFSTLTHTAAGTGLVLTASDGLFTDVDSDTFNINAVSTAIWVEPFTDNSLYTVTIGAEGNDGSADYFQITDGTNINKTYTGNTGNFFAGQDIDDGGWPGSISPSQLSWTGINIDGYSSLNFTGKFASTAFTKIDDSDYILMEYQIDGGGWNNLIAFENDGSTFNTFFLEDTDFDANGDGTQLSGSLDAFTKSIVGTGSLLDLRITIAIDSGDEDIALEDFSLTGTPPTPVGYVYNNGWTPGDPSGVSNSFDTISIIAGTTSLTAPTMANTLTVDAGTTLNITDVAAITATGSIANNGTLNLESTSITYSSLITNVISGTGSVSYNRHVNTNASVGGNDLISAPVTGELFGPFATTNTNIVAGPNVGDTRRLFGPFNKTTGAYQLFDVVNDAAITLDAGVGYRAASTDNGGFSFTGTVNTGNVTQNIINTPALNFPEWNLIGNPYPSYINVRDFLSYEVSPGVTNLDLMLAESAAIYGYDGLASDGYTTYNLLTDPSTLLTPGQGFLVSADPANVAAYDMTFAPSMRRVGNTDDFIAGRSVDHAHLQLQAFNGTANYHTDFYFTDNTTLGLDRGYDAAVFGTNAPDFAIYSHLVEQNTGTDMGIQALSNSDLDTQVVIPLGINVIQGQQVTVSIVDSNLPNNVEVYLEDNVAGTFTLLNTGDYTFTAASTLNDTGRFFLRFTNTTLSIPNAELNGLEIFASASPKVIFVKGQLNSKTSVNLYDIQGRLVLTSSLEANSNTNQIDVSNLNSGVYVVKLNNNTQQKTQKVIIN